MSIRSLLLVVAVALLPARMMGQEGTPVETPPPPPAAIDGQPDLMMPPSVEGPFEFDGSGYGGYPPAWGDGIPVEGHPWPSVVGSGCPCGGGCPFGGCPYGGCTAQHLNKYDWKYYFSKGCRFRSTCDMPPHFPYYPAYHGYYYFRPYNWQHVLEDKAVAPLLGEDPRTPYATTLFERMYALLMVEGPEEDGRQTLPISPSLEQVLPNLERLLEQENGTATP